MRISGAHLSTTWFRAVALDVSVYLKWHRRLMMLGGRNGTDLALQTWL